MAPAPTPTSNSPAARHYHLRRQVTGVVHPQPWQPSAPGRVPFKPQTTNPPLQPSVAPQAQVQGVPPPPLNPRPSPALQSSAILQGSSPPLFIPHTLSPALKPSVIPEGPSPHPFVPKSSGSLAHASNPSGIPSANKQSPRPNRPINIPGILAAAVVTLLILSGLIGLIVAGVTERKQAKARARKRFPPTHSGSTRGRKSKSPKDAAETPGSAKTSNDGFSYGEKTTTPLTPPPPALNKEHRRKLIGFWPIRGLTRVFRRSCSEPDERRQRQYCTPEASPEATWSEFTAVTLCVPSPRDTLARIPEEGEEDYQSQTNSNAGIASLGARLQRSYSVASTFQLTGSEWGYDTSLESEAPSTAEERHYLQDCEAIYTAEAMDDEDDCKPFDSEDPAPESTFDREEPNRTSVASLESFEDGRESWRGEVFELKRAQTRSVQMLMNKGVLVSLSLKTLSEEGESDGKPSSPTANLAEGGKGGGVEPDAVGSSSAVDLDRFPSPPSVLPVIPSFVSGF